MTTSAKTLSLSELLDQDRIPPSVLAYFQSRLKNRIYSYVLNKFIAKEKAAEITRAELARKIGKRPEVITRLLSSPGNWTIETISDLLIGIDAEEMEFSASKILGRAPRNYTQPEWLNQSAGNYDWVNKHQIEALSHRASPSSPIQPNNQKVRSPLELAQI